MSMVKIVLLLTRRPELSHEQFVSYWRTKHAPLVRRVPFLRRYVISLRTKSIAGEPMPDGVAELWFDDMRSLETGTASPEWLAARQDGDNFRTNSIAFITEEHNESP
jgi:uncharacterized protein (TIGR02118 family)